MRGLKHDETCFSMVVNQQQQQEAVPCRLVHLGIDDICDVAWGQQRHSDKFEHVGQVRLTLFSVVFDPV